MSSKLRKGLYEQFARAANDIGVRWIVLSGIEGYPTNIGRDLDVTCESLRDANKLCETFVACLREYGFRWVVFPSPIWGRRVLGITEGYETVELHIVHPVRIAGISLSPAWDMLEYEGDLFPTDPLLRFFKRCLMPALTKSKNWRLKCAQTPKPRVLPWWLRSTARKILSGGNPSSQDRLKLFSAYFISNPALATINLVRWQVRLGVRRSYPAAPVYDLAGRVDPDDFSALAKRSLGEIFAGFACVDECSSKRVRALQAVQYMVFLSKGRTDIRQVRAIPQGVHDDAGLLKFVVEEFCRFNERWHPKGTITQW